MRKVPIARFVLLIILLACCACAFALDPSLDIRQYAHTSWKIRDGFTKGTISSISQTPDGYLWLGTQSGLYRFDGVFATLWHPPAGQQLPNESINSLLVAHDGRLWIGTISGLSSWKDGRLTQYPELAGQTIFSIIEDHEGTVWATTWLPGSSPTVSKLCAVGRGRIECYGVDSFRQGIESVYEDSRGNLWVTGVDGLWRWKPGPPKRYSTFITGPVIEADGGAILLATRDGLR